MTPGLALDGVIAAETREGLVKKGHQMVPLEKVTFWMFGGAQSIMIDRENGIYRCGSDSRFDGCAMAY